eukprot:TRINITY_DN15270_c0_g1_i1.p1 TRINITY_DN15270_c0_g1~~TRINITY_DN15270_c0_g1_i1.p1  ORF type:complete len:613 (+),score=112.66 TRINITY_DN15270_c0_g1_i1:30-1841(+)
MEYKWDPWDGWAGSDDAPQLLVKNTFLEFVDAPSPPVLNRVKSAPARTSPASSNSASSEEDSEAEKDEVAEEQEDADLTGRLLAEQSTLSGTSTSETYTTRESRLEWEPAAEWWDHGQAFGHLSSPVEDPQMRDPARPSGAVKVIDTAEACSEACGDLQHEDVLALDIEGKQLCRHGAICIIQVACRDGRIFLFDIWTLGQDAFDAGLQKVLESDAVVKLLFDCRCDGDALYHQYKVLPSNVVDLQVLREKAKPGGGFLKGMMTALEDVLSPNDFENAHALKLIGRQLFEPDLGGRQTIWEDRPLPDALIEYCAQDVYYLFDMLDRWSNHLAMPMLRAVSERRMYDQMLADSFVHGKHRAQRDFSIPGEDRFSEAKGERDRLHGDLFQRLVALMAFEQQQAGLSVRQAAYLPDSTGYGPASTGCNPPSEEAKQFWQKASPAESPESSDLKLTRIRSKGTGAHRVRWRIQPEKVRRSSDTSMVSPNFEVDIGDKQVMFKLLLYPAVTAEARKVNGERGGNSFRNSAGHGYIVLRCEDNLPECSSSISFRFFVGQQEPRGPVQHDFGKYSVGGLHESSRVWSFANEIENQKLEIGAEIMVTSQFQ